VGFFVFCAREVLVVRLLHALTGLSRGHFHRNSLIVCAGGLGLLALFVTFALGQNPNSQISTSGSKPQTTELSRELSDNYSLHGFESSASIDITGCELRLLVKYNRVCPSSMAGGGGVLSMEEVVNLREVQDGPIGIFLSPSANGEILLNLVLGGVPGATAATSDRGHIRRQQCNVPASTIAIPPAVFLPLKSDKSVGLKTDLSEYIRSSCSK
jgi:hypothetical protein